MSGPYSIAAISPWSHCGRTTSAANHKFARPSAATHGTVIPDRPTFHSTARNAGCSIVIDNNYHYQYILAPAKTCVKFLFNFFEFFYIPPFG